MKYKAIILFLLLAAAVLPARAQRAQRGTPMYF
jgi:hypothetical protein